MDKGTKHVFSNSSRADAGQGPKNGTPDPPDNSIPRIMSGQESQPLGHTVPVCPLLEGRSLIISGVHSPLMLSLYTTPRTKLGAADEAQPDSGAAPLVTTPPHL